MKRFGWLSALVVVLATTVPAAASDPLPPGGTFLDDDLSIHQGWIEAIAAAGITTGCRPTGDRYCPDNPVTRGEMAAFLTRALDLTGDPDPDRFADDDDSIFETDIGRIATAGITKGCNPPDNDRFCPEATVTRAQMAAFLVRGFGLEPSGLNPFTDDDGSIFESDIAALAAAGVTIGCNPPLNDRFCPDGPVTRAEMATFLGRALGLNPIDVPDRPTVIDVVPRSGWGAAPVDGTLIAHEIDHITIHHAGDLDGTTGPPQFLGWQAWHQFLGWPDIAYHFIVGRDGLVYEGRPWGTAGDTATEYDPHGHFLIVVEGNFDNDAPNQAQLDALAAMVVWASQLSGVEVHDAMGHRDHAATTCPGDALYAALHNGELEALADAIADAGGVTLTYDG